MGSIFTAVKDGFFHADRERGLPNLQRIVPAAIDVARALEHLHAVGVIHGDLKSQNVLLQASDSDERGYVCKVCDFGFSRLAINRTHIQTFTCGSVRAMPPEVLKDGFLTPAADVYSFGILLWELLRGGGLLNVIHIDLNDVRGLRLVACSRSSLYIKIQMIKKPRKKDK